MPLVFARRESLLLVAFVVSLLVNTQAKKQKLRSMRVRISGNLVPSWCILCSMLFGSLPRCKASVSREHLREVRARARHCLFASFAWWQK